ncbi:hypothetical protein PI125_g24507 [Phytophthora idaei]|nr:hypothetical protein PI125_g24507 [Phytophthora idaei]
MAQSTQQLVASTQQWMQSQLDRPVPAAPPAPHAVVSATEATRSTAFPPSIEHGRRGRTTHRVREQSHQGRSRRSRSPTSVLGLRDSLVVAAAAAVNIAHVLVAVTTAATLSPATYHHGYRRRVTST